MKKHLDRQELIKIKQLLESKDKSNHQLAQQLLKEAKDLTPSFLTFLFSNAFFSPNKNTREFFQEILQPQHKELFELGNNKFIYDDYRPDHSQLNVFVNSFHSQMKLILSSPLLKTKTLFSFFIQSKHTLFVPSEFAGILLLLGLEFSLLNQTLIKSITELDIPELNHFPKNLDKLPNLNRLGLNNISINQFPKSFQQLKQLEYLKIQSSSIDEFKLSSSIFQLPKLKCLSFQDCSLTGHPNLWKAICNSTRLTHLFISDNFISYIPKYIENLQNLETLGLKSKHLQAKNIPIEIFQLPNLQRLILYEHMMGQEDILEKASLSNPSLRIQFSPFFS
ncbi:MAG: hypothetical protein GY810_16300 [Aureispira sp.]|nr:hypothetical protein [Aureispira sp.]